jgi:hypothetical protein
MRLCRTYIYLLRGKNLESQTIDAAFIDRDSIRAFPICVTILSSFITIAHVDIAKDGAKDGVHDGTT